MAGGPAAPNSPTACRLLTVALTYLGRQEEAQRAAARLMTINPKHSIANWRARTPLTKPEHVELIAKGLRAAGVPL
jgi:hypothetical protein